MTNPPITEKTVAFFVALTDDNVKKDWSELSKASFVVVPTVVRLAVTKGAGTSKRNALRSLIAPGIVLAKIAREVNSQVTPAHLEKAHVIVEDLKQKSAAAVEQGKVALQKVKKS
ncbi:MAG: hypothetical protein RLZZ508_11 [Actinomycetota bacterium]|jgi:hypothetical protein